MATRRMRIKAVINVPRSTVKSEPANVVDQSVPSPAPVNTTVEPSAPSSPAQRIYHHGSGTGPASPLMPELSSSMEVMVPDRPAPSHTPPKSPRSLQRPSPSKSPACLLPASGSILRRSPSPALSRLTNSPGPPIQSYHSPQSPKSPVPNYSSPSSPIKTLSRSRSPVVIIPTMMVQSPSTSATGRITPIESVKSPPPYVFRPPPSPSPSTSTSYHHNDFHPINSPGSPAGSILSRPSPSQSPVLYGGGISRSSATSFLYQHLNSNSNSADSHEVASLMSSPSSEINVADKKGSRSSSSSGGAFSSVSNKINSTSTPSPSFSKTMFEDPESLKKRLDEKGKKEGAPPSKFSALRKEFFEKLQSGNVPQKLTMLHYTFYNPPDPNGTKSKRKSRSRASSVCSDVSTISKQEQTDRDAIANNENKAASAPSSIAGSRRTTASSVASGASAAPSETAQSEHGSVSSTDSNVPGPRVKVGPNGELIIDEKSLVVETSQSQRARQQIENMEVVLGSANSGMYRYKKSFKRGCEWTERETIRFYRALNQCGTDFSMMTNLFPWRTRQELKSKFKREDKKNPDMISRALQSCFFDPTEKFSDDEEDEKFLKEKGLEGLTEKERLLNEEKEIEEVICSAGDGDGTGTGPGGKRKKPKKEKPFQLTKAQLQEINKNHALMKGAGTGKGRKWNSPVIGMEDGKKLPSPVKPVESSKKVKVKSEKEQEAAKEKRKIAKKNKKEAEKNSLDQPGAVSIIIAPGVLSDPILPQSMKQEKVDPNSNTTENSKKAPVNPDKAKKRIRLPKAKPKPNVKKTEKRKTDEINKKPPSILGLGMCDDLFRFDPATATASDQLPLPAPLPVVQETELCGDEEGTEGLVIVDLDELQSIQAQASEESTTTTTTIITTKATPVAATPSTENPSEGKRRKRKKAAPVPVTRRVVGDPYGKAALTTVIASSDDSNVKSGNESDALTSKKVKVLPYRVPGPGGVVPTSSSMADDLEIEIELNLSSSASVSNES